MSIETVPGADLKYYLIAYDKHGKERDDDPDGLMSQVALNALVTEGSDPVTDVFIISHGWKGDISSAREQYNSDSRKALKPLKTKDLFFMLS
jgi:hypothetical protein